VSAQLSSLPSVDRLLNTETLRRAQQAHGRERVTAAVRERLAHERESVKRNGAAVVADLDALATSVATSLDDAARASLRGVINMTGTVLHTNLGRALLPRASIEALISVAMQPCNLEFDLATGGRGERDSHVEDVVRELTGAEAALVVNNNAAAVLLVLNTLAQRKEVVVSRGELVEIGGQFRIPDIMKRAGALLREVGTTNRTHARDYADAIGSRTAALLKVHTSNYEIRGFTAAVGVEETAAMARARGLVLVVDLGSGTLLDLRRFGLPHEPTVHSTLQAGADVVTFSGDKLLGGPQCGVVAGRRDLIERMRRNPLKRALRVDKLILAALEQVLRLYLHPERLQETLPTLRLLTRPREEIERIARRVADRIAPQLPDYAVDVIECTSQIGSGALPVETLPSCAARIRSTRSKRERHRALERLNAALRGLPTPVVGRIDDDALLLDCRCVEDVDALIGSLSLLQLR
jgi:L-seryl-tRNA(Ser) seleniumtransferase